MAANWINVRYVGTTPISVNFKTWYPNEIHAMPEGQLEDFKRIHGDVLQVLGPDEGGVPGEGPARQQWPYGPMTDAPMAFEPTPGDPLTAVNVTLTNDAPAPESVERAQEAAANPPPVQPAAVPARAQAPVEPVISAEQQAKGFVVATTGEAPKGEPVKSAVPTEDTPPVQGEPRTGNEVETVEPAQPAQAAKGKGSK